MYSHTDSGGRQIKYKHALIDTKVVSDMIKGLPQSHQIASKLIDKALADNWLLSISPANPLELAKQPWLLDEFYKFCAAFQIVALLKGADQIEREETSNCLNSMAMEICPHTSIVAQIVGPNGEKLIGYDLVKQMFERAGINEWSPKILAAAKNRFEDDESRREAYHEYCKAYGPKVVSEKVIRFQLEQIDHRLSNVDCARFPSMQSYFAGTYFKFYEDKNRRMTVNDVIDLMMFSILPYVDVFVSEGNNIDIVKKIKAKFGLLKHLEVFQITEFRSGGSNKAAEA